MVLYKFAFNFNSYNFSSDDSAANPPPAKKSRGLLAHYKSAPLHCRTPAEDNPQ